MIDIIEKTKKYSSLYLRQMLYESKKEILRKEKQSSRNISQPLLGVKESPGALLYPEFFTADISGNY